MYSVLPTHQIITNFYLLKNWFMYTIFQCKNCLKPLTKVKSIHFKICYWCLFMMQSEKAKLISCFVNDYCIPTTLFKTISKLNIVFSICTQKELCKLWSCFFQTTPFKRKKGKVRSPVLYLSLSLSLLSSIFDSTKRRGSLIHSLYNCTRVQS